MLHIFVYLEMEEIVSRIDPFNKMNVMDLTDCYFVIEYVM